MKKHKITSTDRFLAGVCASCPVCRHARKTQAGAAYSFVRTIEAGVCPFCQAYERVHGRKAHEPVPGPSGT
jgi:Zn ribbon nucleic-acid-binding protein